MKINVFKIPKEKVVYLKDKIQRIGMHPKYVTKNDGWECVFYLSSKPEVEEISWVQEYRSIVTGLESVKNIVYYALYFCIKDDYCFVLTYGKSHFYVRKFCDQNFGLEIAKRIANENDVKQKASKRFSGRKKKEIKSFIKNTRLDNESGESVDFISAGIVEAKKVEFGEKSKFGASVIISKEDLGIEKIPNVLEKIIHILENEKPLFDLPKTTEVKDPAQIASYEKGLLEQIKRDISNIETEDNSYDLVGADFIFYTNEKYIFQLGFKRSPQIPEISHENLKYFIEENKISDEEIFNIKIEVSNDSGRVYTKSLYEMIEYMVPEENVVLEGGKWKKFNEEYVGQINTSIDAIEVEKTEEQFSEISSGEPEFNSSGDLKEIGYECGDRDFSRIKIGPGYKVEAWDLKKEKTVYAVKFGRPQQLVYVCSQAIATLDIIRNNANLKKLDDPPKRYCLWLGFTIPVPEKISQIKSIILKLHIDMFARKCREVGIEPVLKFSKKIE